MVAAAVACAELGQHAVRAGGRRVRRQGRRARTCSPATGTPASPATTYTRVDDRYPAPIAPFWGNVVELDRPHRPGRRRARARRPRGADAHVPVLRRPVRPLHRHRLRHRRPRLSPRARRDLRTEPRLGNLTRRARAGRRRVGRPAHRATCSPAGDWHAVSDAAYRRYDELGLDDATCAFVEDGAVVVEHADGWRRHSALEGEPGPGEPVRPRVLRTVPAEFRTGLDAVLHGTDGNTYLFKGALVLRHPAQAGGTRSPRSGAGRATRSTPDDAVDAAFVGCRRQDLRVQRRPVRHLRAGSRLRRPRSSGDPRPIAEHWGGLPGRGAGVRP